MSDWRNYFDKNESEPPRAIIAKIAKTPEKPIIAIIANIALRSESEKNDIYEKMLTKIADEAFWSADDLLDWFRSDLDEIAGMQFYEVKEVVLDYLTNISLLRGEEHHMTRMIDPYFKVKCRDCRLWTPDEISAGGIGSCDFHESPMPPAWPGADRRCFEFEEK